MFLRIKSIPLLNWLVFLEFNNNQAGLYVSKVYPKWEQFYYLGLGSPKKGRLACGSFIITEYAQHISLLLEVDL